MPLRGIQALLNQYFALQGALHGAALGDLRQTMALGLIQRAEQRQLLLNPIEEPLAGLALGAVLCVNAIVPQPDLDAFQRPSMSVGVQAQRHRCTRAQR